MSSYLADQAAARRQFALNNANVQLARARMQGRPIAPHIANVVTANQNVMQPPR